MIEINEQKIIKQLKKEFDSISENINRLEFELVKKQGAIDEFEKLFFVNKQEKTEKSLGKDGIIQ